MVVRRQVGGGLQQRVGEGEEEMASVDMFFWHSGCEGKESTKQAAGRGHGTRTGL